MSTLLRPHLLAAFAASACLPVATEAATLAVTEPLVSGTAVFDAFDTLGGTRSLNFATVAIDLEADVSTNPITNGDAAPTTIDLELDVFLSWAPDDVAYHAEPTDVGTASVTINTPIEIAGGDTVEASATHVLPTQSYVENTYNFNEQYGVLLLSAVTGQTVSVVSGVGDINGIGASIDLSGTVTVEYDYTTVPEPAAFALLAMAGSVAVGRRVC